METKKQSGGHWQRSVCLTDPNNKDSWENSGCLGETADVDLWENIFTNEATIKDLQDENLYENNVIDTHNFWDENLENQNKISSLIAQEETVKKEHEDIVSLWDDDKIIFSLLDNEDDEDKTLPIQFLSTYEWDDVDILNGLLENNNNETKNEKEEKKEENWSVWDDFETTDDILEASEKIHEPKNIKKQIQRELVIEVRYDYLCLPYILI